jgi:hypothetical protein
MTAMTWRLAAAFLLQGPSRQQIQSGPHLSPGHDRVGTAAVAAEGQTIDTHQHREQAATLWNGPAVEPQKEQRSAMFYMLEQGFD